jgi:hypothetical protein
METPEATINEVFPEMKKPAEAGLFYALTVTAA